MVRNDISRGQIGRDFDAKLNSKGCYIHKAVSSPDQRKDNAFFRELILFPVPGGSASRSGPVSCGD